MRRAPLVALALAGALAACAYVGGRTEPYRVETVVDVAGGERGRDLYMRDCAWCHGNTGQGTRHGPDLVSGTNGPALTHFVLTTGRMPLRSPEQRMRPSAPAYGPDEIEDIVDYVAGFGQPGPAVPTPDVAGADLPLGQELYQENCAACHSTTGIGGALASGDAGGSRPRRPNIATPLGSATPVEVAEAVLTGPGTMPVFGEDTLSEEELDAVVAYVMYLQRPADPGGYNGGGVGPVAEGAVGWIVGLGLLLGFIRWIGTKTVPR